MYHVNIDENNNKQKNLFEKYFLKLKYKNKHILPSKCARKDELS